MGDAIETIVAERAIEAYRQRVKEDEAIKKLLENKKFHLNDIVIKKGTSYFDNVFDVCDMSIGKIVGYDTEYDYYRVYYNDRMNYVGVKEEKLELYEGEVPQHVKEKKPMQIKRIIVDL